MTVIQIKGPIVSDDMGPVYDYFKRPATYPKQVSDQLPDDGSDVQIDINSGGGLVDSGSEIYTALREYPGHVTANVVGTAASAASIIAMAADEVRMSPVAQIMIHNVQAEAYGDNRDHEHLAEVLKSANEALASAYTHKTGMKQEDVLDLMDKTTWLNAKEAIKQGFADGMMFEDDEGIALTASVEDLMTPEQLEMGRKMMNQLNKPNPPKISISATGITGTALANAYIKADNRAGKKIAEGHAAADGSFSLKVTLKPGDQVRVTQSTQDGTSKPAVADMPEKSNSEGSKLEDMNVTITIANYDELMKQLTDMKAELKTIQDERDSQNKWEDPFF